MEVLKGYSKKFQKTICGEKNIRGVQSHHTYEKVKFLKYTTENFDKIKPNFKNCFIKKSRAVVAKMSLNVC